MIEKRKIWAGVSAAMLGSVTTPQAAADQDSHTWQQNPAIFSFWEGEGNAGTVHTNDADFLSQLGLVRGHLWVGMRLYREDHLSMAKTHMKHPKDELYVGLLPAFKARNLHGFADALTTLSTSVLNEASLETVDANYTALLSAISENEQLHHYSAQTVLISIAKMLRTAADEYALAVEQGKLVNTHEYQDAMGFKSVAFDRLNSMSTEQQAEAGEGVDEVKHLINDLADFWPGTTPEGKLEGDISRIYASAARIELIGLNL